MLATRRHKSNETLAEFSQSLKKLSEDCIFEAVTGEQYRIEMVRDFFIYGMASLAVRQRLLENEDLNLERAYDLTLSLNRAQEHYFVGISPLDGFDSSGSDKESNFDRIE